MLLLFDVRTIVILNSKTKRVMLRNHPKFLLLATAANLMALNLNLSDRIGKSDFLFQSILFWVSALFLLWQKRDRLHLESDTTSSVVGSLLLALVIYKSLYLFQGDYFIRIAPLLSLLGWGLLASGIKGLKQYWREIFLLGFLAIPWEFVYVFDVSLITAKFSAFILWILGFEVTVKGIWLILPTGSVEVYSGCSGVQMMLHLLGLSWIVLAIAKTNWQQKIWLTIAAILIGFIVNGIRVALMAVLVALSDSEGFTYWHVGNGSLIFSAISVLIFGAICMRTIRSENKGVF